MITTSRSDGATAASPATLPKLPITLDAKGRVRVSPEQRRKILAEFARSGESAPRFARSLGLKYSTFAAWVARDRRARRAPAAPPMRLLEAVMAPAPTDFSLPVQLPGGARVELQNLNQISLLAALLRALEKPC
jgi:transposase-like protein